MSEKRFRPARLSVLIAAAFLLAAGSTIPAQTAVGGQEIPRGKVIESVACADDAEQSYAVYLPTGFDPARTWPVLILFDSGARGPLAVEAFREAAETFG